MPSETDHAAMYTLAKPDCLEEPFITPRPDFCNSYGPELWAAEPPLPPHPLQEAYDAAIAQATGGKGVRHGGNSTPFMEQRWYRIAKSTGEGGLLFQGIKKAEEAGDKDDDEAFERELLGSLVYLGMTYLYFKRHGRK